MHARPRSTSGLDEHLHPPAADQAVVPAVVVVELKADDFRPCRRSRMRQRLAFHFGLDAAAAQRAGLRAVGEDEHRGARPFAASSRAFPPAGSKPPAARLGSLNELCNKFAHRSKL